MRGDPLPVLDRLAVALLTESYGGYIIANDGHAYPPGSPVWVALRRSLDLPHDRVVIRGVEKFSDGRSTGPLQQISHTANDAMNPPVMWGWGSLAETMDAAAAALMFVKALQVTDEPVYVDRATGERVTLSSPIAADVLRVQRPAIASARSSNYGPDNVAFAQRMVRGGPRFFTDNRR